MSEEKRPRPIAGGSLEERPIEHILLYVLEKKLSGSLRLDFDDETKLGVYLHQGRPAVASWSPKFFLLEDILVELEIVDSEELSLVRKGAGAGVDTIETLRCKGILDDAALARAVREQIRRSLLAAFKKGPGRYAFYENLNVVADAQVSRGFPIDVLPVLTEGIRRRGLGETGTRLLSKLSKRSVRLADPSALARLGLEPSEQRASRILFGPEKNLDVLLKTHPKERPELQRILYLTLLLRVLEVGSRASSGPNPPAGPVQKATASNESAAATAGPPAQEPVPAEPAPRAAPESLLRRLAELEEAVNRGDFFEMLGVEHGASPEAARAAFMKLAKELHPDRVAKKLEGEDRKRLADIFATLTEAHATLTHPQSRQEYLSGLCRSEPKEHEEQLQIRNAVEAESSYQKALVFLRRSETQKAAEMLDRALELAPEEPEYVACWAHTQAVQRGPEASVDDLLVKMRFAAEKAPKSVKVLSYLAHMLKRAGRLNEAAAQFEKVLEQSPSNIDAARELRLIRMRIKREADKSKGFFEKLFK